MPQIEVTERERLAYPTYRTASRIVNGDMTAPVEFFGWTVLRSLIIMPGLALAGVRGWKIVTGALAGSTCVSMFALYRSYATKQAGKYAELRAARARHRLGAGPSRRPASNRRSRMRRS